MWTEADSTMIAHEIEGNHSSMIWDSNVKNEPQLSHGLPRTHVLQ